MYVVTNRQIRENKKGLAVLGARPNHEGPNELRLLDIRRSGGGWRVDIVPDRLDAATKKKIGLPVNQPAFGSNLVAHNLFQRARREKRNVLLFVHGYNNDIEDVLARAERLERTYGVIPVPFSWPANGGGWRGVADYKADKRDARASAGALDRTISKTGGYLSLLTEKRRLELHEQAAKKHPDNSEARNALYSRLLTKECPFTVNLMLHSMGNYLFKQMLKTTAAEGDGLIFDNVVMVAADTNNRDHVAWVDRIRCRNRLYITINEHDRALRASRAKAGEEQLARLGHYPFDLTSEHAVYVDFTDCPWVKSSHSYFEDQPVRNGAVKAFFNTALNGGIAEDSLRYRPDRNVYKFQ